MELILEHSEEEIVLYFDISSDAIDAQTFAHSLLAFDELYRSISAILDPGGELEIDFVRSDPGSIRAILRSIKKDTRALLRSPLAFVVFPILINVISNWISSDDIKIIVDDKHYIVQHGNERIVLPKVAEEVVQKVADDNRVRHSAKKLFAVTEADPNVKAVDFRSPSRPMDPVVPVVRDNFGLIRNLPEIEPVDLPRNREQLYFRQEVVVVTAVLEKSAKKWQFIWAGQKVSADIRDDDFFFKLAQHEYEFGQGDILDVDLLVEQKLNEFVGAYENEKFHVVKVHSHSSGPRQGTLPLKAARKR